MTQDPLDEIEQALNSSCIALQNECPKHYAIDKNREALTTLQTYRKTHISIARDDVPEGLQQAVSCYPMDDNDDWIKNTLNQLRTNKGLDTGKAVVKAATLIAERMEDD